MKYFFISTFLISFFSCSSNSNKKADEENVIAKKHIVVKKILLNRPAYKLEYPYNWRIDSADNDYDIDTYFSLDSPTEGCFAKFIFFNTRIDEKEHLSEHVKEHLKVTTKNGTVSYFEKWGSYKGHGATIKGKILGVFNGELKIFVHSNDSSSFLIFSQLLDEDKLNDEPGLTMIENSFRAK